MNIFYQLFEILCENHDFCPPSEDGHLHYFVTKTKDHQFTSVNMKHCQYYIHAILITFMYKVKIMQYMCHITKRTFSSELKRARNRNTMFRITKKFLMYITGLLEVFGIKRRHTCRLDLEIQSNLAAEWIHQIFERHTWSPIEIHAKGLVCSGNKTKYLSELDNFDYWTPKGLFVVVETKSCYECFFFRQRWSSWSSMYSISSKTLVKQ